MKQSGSFEQSKQWYSKLVGKKGHYYHEHVALPAAYRLLELEKQSRLLDVGCGQGVVGRTLPLPIEYWGVDISRSLIAEASRFDKVGKHRYVVADATTPWSLPKDHFTHAVMMLSLQNMENLKAVFGNISKSLLTNGVLVMVINHPAFRIPRQSGWSVNETQKQQTRWVARYMSFMKIPIETHPSQGSTQVTMSYHYPISTYIHELGAAGMMIEAIEELVSDKESDGTHRKMENRSRQEIPLFMAIKAVKIQR